MTPTKSTVTLYCHIFMCGWESSIKKKLFYDCINSFYFWFGFLLWFCRKDPEKYANTQKFASLTSILNFVFYLIKIRLQIVYIVAQIKLNVPSSNAINICFVSKSRNGREIDSDGNKIYITTIHNNEKHDGDK